MAPPTQISGSPWTSAWNSTTSPKLAPTGSGTFAVSTGDLIAVAAVNENNGAFGTPTNAAGSSPATITWTSRANTASPSHCRAQVWTGAVTAGGNVQVSVTLGAQDFGIIVWAFSSHNGVGQAVGNVGSASAPSLAPGSAWTANSTVCCANGDWTAVSHGATRSYRTNLGTATERNYSAVDGNYTTEAWEHADAGASPGSGAIGLTTPNMTWSMVAVEVLAPAGGGSTTPVTVSASCASTATVARQANLIRATTAAATATVVRQAKRTLSATSAASAVVVRQPSRILSTTAACTATVASLKARFVDLTASAASTATRIVQAQRIVSASAADSAVIVRRPQRTLAASCASTATNTALKVILLTVSATTACTATVSRIAAHVLTLTATAAATAVLARNVRRTLTTSAGDNASVTAQGPGGGTAPPGQRPTLGVG